MGFGTHPDLGSTRAFHGGFDRGLDGTDGNGLEKDQGMGWSDLSTLEDKDPTMVSGSRAEMANEAGAAMANGVTNVVKEMVESAEETFEELRLSQHKLTSALNNLNQALDVLAAEVPDFPKIDAHSRTIALQKRVSTLQDKIEQLRVKIRRIEIRLSQLEGDS